MTAELFLSQARELRPRFTIPALARSAGHPDEIAGGMAEAVAGALEDEARRSGLQDPVFSLGATVLLPGIAVPRFGGGRTGLPMRLVVAGSGRRVPALSHARLGEVALRASQDWARANLRHVDPRRHLAAELHLRDPGTARSTSIGVARAPASASQFLAQEAVALATGPEFRRQFPEVGDEVEASALAEESTLRMRLSIAMIDRHVHSERAYFLGRKAMEAFLLEKVRALPSHFDRIELHVNPDDEPGRGEEGCLLTVLGTTADGRRPGHCNAAPEGETTSTHAEAFARMLTDRVRGVRVAVVRLEEDDRGEIRHAFVRLELDAGISLETIRPAVAELVPQRALRTRRIDASDFA